MTLLVIYITMALTVSFLCSVLEVVLLSVTPGYMAHLETEQPAVGRRLRDLKVRVDRPLAAILSLNTIAHTAGAAGAGAQAQRLWSSEILTVFSIGLTLLILVFSEIIPKTLGALHWRKLLPGTVRILRVMMLVLYPLVALSELLTRTLEKRHPGAHKISREEMAALAQLGREAGFFGESQSRILRNLFRLADLRTRDIMTPRTVMFALPESTTVGDVLESREAAVFSRIPVYRKDLDDIIGYVLKDEILLRAARGERTVSVGTLTRPHLVVPELLPVPQLFEMLLDRREHIALVVDEYGGIDGVVTMEDVLETIVGIEIVDEADRAVDLREIARRRWRARSKRMAASEPPVGPGGGGSK